MEKKRAFLINIGYYGFFIILLILAGKYVLPVIMPFVVAFVLAFLIHGPAGWLAERGKLPKKYVSLSILILIYLLVFGTLSLGGGKTFSMIRDFVIRIPQMYQSDIAPFLNYVLEEISDTLSETDPFVAGQIEESLQQFVQSIGQAISAFSVDLLSGVSGFLTGIPALLIRVVITVVTSFYICADYDKIMETVWKHLPAKARTTCSDIKKYGFNILKVYLKSYTLLFLMTFTELLIGFLILRIPYPVVIALAIAVFDILPVLGTGGVLIPWAVILAVIGNYSMAVEILLLYIVITVVRNFAEPRIVGKQIGLHPLITLIAMFTGVSLFGLPGLILFPMTVVILVNMEKNGALHLFNREEKSNPE